MAAMTSLKCDKCNVVNEPGERYGAQCSEYLAVPPGAAHKDLLQLSPDDFLTTVSEGLPLILDNAKRLWAKPHWHRRSELSVARASFRRLLRRMRKA